jgi:cytidine deaminase
MLSEKQRRRLVSDARAAAGRAFLTSQRGTAYGAAVLTSSGQVYQAGQYSSFNHITNVHAEQAALLLATMAGDPDILALAVASTGAESVTRPCGICRQVLFEHATRTGRNFEVLMASRHNADYEVATVSDLLPLSWLPSHELLPRRGADVRCTLGRPSSAFQSETLQSGDHVVLVDGCVAIVWDGQFEPGRALVKLKYAPSESGLRKLSHSFTEPLFYQKELHDLGWNRAAKCGILASVVDGSEISTVLRTLQLGNDVGEPPGLLMQVLRDAGVEITAIRVTGSRALGLHRPHSDWDLVIPAEFNLIPKIRDALAKAIERGVLGIPPQSGTWKLVDQIFPGGHQAALRSRRFVDTVLSDVVSVALMFVPPQPQEDCVGLDWKVVGRKAVFGKVVDADRAAYKRAQYDIQDEDGIVHVTCFHKAANLLRTGDIISACGWLLRRGDERRLIQILPQPDRILWWHVASPN